MKRFVQDSAHLLANAVSNHAGLLFAAGLCFFALTQFLPRTDAPKNDDAEFRAAGFSLVQPQNEKKKAAVLDSGKASYYGKKFTGRTTASGEIFDQTKFTAAHKTIPFGTYVRVVREDSTKSVVVKINDRGPFTKGRVIDLSTAAAQKIDMVMAGVIQVRVLSATKDEFKQQFEKKKPKP